MRPLLLALLLLFPIAAAAQDRAAQSPPPKPAALIADQVRVENQNVLIAEGAVEVLYDTSRLRAERITFDQRTGQLTIEGPITLVDGENTLILADAATLDKDLQNGILTSARIVLQQQLQIAAAQVRRVDGRYAEMSKTVASACKVCASNPVPLWSIRARRVIHDQVEHQLYFDHPTFRIMNVPVFWVPQLRLPDPTLTRATGFLLPQARQSSQLGFGIKVPYFIALGPSKDVTLTPYVSPHTRTLEGRYRQAFRHGAISFEGAVTRDDILPGETRAYLFGAGVFQLPRDFRLSFGVQLTSDPSYLLDYGYSDADRLLTFLQVDRVSRNERIVAALNNFRTLREPDIPIEDTLPYLLGAASYERRFQHVGGGIAKMAVGLSGFQRLSEDDYQGRDELRLGFLAQWQRMVLLRPGIQTSFTAQLTALNYFINQDPGYPSQFPVVTPAVDVTLRWPFRRTTRRGAVQLLQPLAQVAWSQTYGTEPPNEDSTLVEFDTGNLLSIDRFPGEDRAEDGLRAALGVAWNHYDPTGWQLAATVGRVFRTEADYNFSQASGLIGPQSDWLTAFRIMYGSHLSLASHTLVHDGLDITKSETRLDWVGQSLNLGATYVWIIADPAEGRDNPTNAVSFDTDFRFRQNWRANAGIRYDVEADRASWARIGLEFRNECVTLDLSLSRRFTSSTSVTPTTDVGLKVSLNGFGRDGRDYAGTCTG